MRIFLTGSAGFIGFHLAQRLLEGGHSVTGFDGMTPYYDVRLKEARQAILERHSAFRAYNDLLENADALTRAAEAAEPDVMIHLAAQAGVRYSIECPQIYASANLVGSFNVLEVARRVQPRHLLLASTSSVYGGNDRMPFREADKADAPLTLYAATKKSMEVMSHAYSHLFHIPTTCFRFFTVYGPWGRPDMALFKFVDGIEKDRPIEIYGQGAMKRDFTYVADLVESIVRLVHVAPSRGSPALGERVDDTLSASADWRVVNIGGGNPVGLLEFVETIEERLGKKALRKMLPMQAGDVRATVADNALLQALVGPQEWTPVANGVAAFVDWYRKDYCRLMAPEMS